MRKKPQIKSLVNRKYRKPGFHNPTTSYKVFDLSIIDVAERQAQALTYESGEKLGRAIGIKPSHIRQYTNPKDQKKYFSQKLGTYLAIRVFTGV